MVQRRQLFSRGNCASEISGVSPLTSKTLDIAVRQVSFSIQATRSPDRCQLFCPSPTFELHYGQLRSNDPRSVRLFHIYTGMEPDTGVYSVSEASSNLTQNGSGLGCQRDVFRAHPPRLVKAMRKKFVVGNIGASG